MVNVICSFEEAEFQVETLGELQIRWEITEKHMLSYSLYQWDIQTSNCIVTGLSENRGMLTYKQLADLGINGGKADCSFRRPRRVIAAKILSSSLTEVVSWFPRKPWQIISISFDSEESSCYKGQNFFCFRIYF